MATPAFITCRDDGIMLDLYVQPGARELGAAGTHDGRLKIKLTKPPADGKANRQLCTFLAGQVGLSRSRVCLRAGETHRCKRVFIAARGAEQVSVLAAVKTLIAEG